jgi:hypothetical protein
MTCCIILNIVIFYRNPMNSKGGGDKEEAMQAPPEMMLPIHQWLDKAASLRLAQSRGKITKIISGEDMMVRR